MEHDIQADVDAVMKKYDRESNTRVWEGGPKDCPAGADGRRFSVYCILMTLFSKALPERRLSLFLGFIIIIGYLVYPAKKGACAGQPCAMVRLDSDGAGRGQLLLLCHQRLLHHSAGHQAPAHSHHHRHHRHSGADRAVPPLRGPAHSVRAGRSADLHLL